MTTSLSKPDPSALPADDFEEIPPGEHNACDARLGGLSCQQLVDRLCWLSWYQPGTFTAVMDYMEFCDTLAADTDSTSAGRDPDDSDDAPPLCALDAKPTSASSSSSASSGGTTGRATPSARQRSSIPATPLRCCGSSPAEARTRFSHGSSRVVPPCRFPWRGGTIQIGIEFELL